MEEFWLYIHSYKSYCYRFLRSDVIVTLHVFSYVLDFKGLKVMIVDILELKSIVLFFPFSFLYLIFLAFSWVTWTLFRIPFWFIYSIFNCISLYRFLKVVILDIVLCICNFSLLIPTFYYFEGNVEALLPLRPFCTLLFTI